MDNRREIIGSFYGEVDEDSRLGRSRHGQLEFRTTMHYIHRFAQKGAKILETGAGTGRYSAALAKEGYDVTAVELVSCNCEQLFRAAEGIDNLAAFQGDAVDLSRFDDGEFDMVLALGPFYHLYERSEIDRALSEAVRVTKPGGVIIAAFLSVHAIMYCNYLKETLAAGLEENFDVNWNTRHFAEQLFTGYEITEFEALWDGLPTEHIVTAAADGVMELAEQRNDFSMTDDRFEMYWLYHRHFCERRELLGASSHLLYICRKEQGE